MNRVFADTSYYLALVHARDAWHERAERLFRELRSGIVTTEYVLLELGALMSRGDRRNTFLALVNHLPTTKLHKLFPPQPSCSKLDWTCSESDRIRNGRSRIAFRSVS